MSQLVHKGVFDTVDFTTGEGIALRRLLEGRVAEKQRQLESPDLSERDTALVRGAIQELRRLLSEAPPHVAPLRYSGNNRGIA